MAAVPTREGECGAMMTPFAVNKLTASSVLAVFRAVSYRLRRSPISSMSLDTADEMH